MESLPVGSGLSVQNNPNKPNERTNDNRPASLGVCKHIPNINPPIDNSQIPDYSKYYLEYNEAVAACEKAGIFGKMEAGQPLSFEEKALFVVLRNAERKLVEIGIKLFKNAFIKADPSENDFAQWKIFADTYHLLKEVLIGLPKAINILFVLSCYNIENNERKALFDFFVTNKANPQKITNALRTLYIKHYKEANLSYNGWIDPQLITQKDPFLNLFDVLSSLSSNNAQNIEKLMVSLSSNYKEYMLALSEEEAKGYYTMGADEFWHAYTILQTDFNQTAPGTEQKVLLYRKLCDLETMAYARGLSYIDYAYTYTQKSLPNLTDTEYQYLSQLDFYIQNDMINTATIAFCKSLFTYFATQYFTVDASKKPYYARAMSEISSKAQYFRISYQDQILLLNEACEKTNCTLSGQDKIENMAVLSSGNPYQVTPENLPKEVIDILKQTGYWELVKNNLNCIGFYAEINEGDPDIAGKQSAGIAYPLLKRVELDYMDENGKIISAFSIAATLIHEAAHVDWMNRKDLLLQKSTPNERHAFAVEYGFYAKYKDTFGINNFTKDEITDYNVAFTRTKTAVMSANEQLGYPVYKMDPEYDALPTNEFLISCGLYSPEELDMYFYPTDPPFWFLQSREKYERFIVEKHLAADTKTIDITWEVLTGKATLEVVADINNGKVQGIPQIWIVRGGTRVKLSNEEIASLDKFFNSVINHFPHEPLNPYHALIVFGSMAQNKQPTINKAQMISKLNENQVPDYENIRLDLINYGVAYNPSDAIEFAKEKMPAFLENIEDVLKSPFIPASFGFEDFSNTIILTKQLILDPSVIHAAVAMSKSPAVAEKDRIAVKAALLLYEKIKNMSQDPSKLIGLIDIATEHLGKIFFNDSRQVTVVHKSTSLMLNLWNVYTFDISQE